MFVDDDASACLRASNHGGMSRPPLLQPSVPPIHTHHPHTKTKQKTQQPTLVRRVEEDAAAATASGSGSEREHLIRSVRREERARCVRFLLFALLRLDACMTHEHVSP